MAFTTIQGSGANDATSFVGTAGADSITIQNVSGTVFAGGQLANDTINTLSSTGSVTGYTLRGGQGDDNITAFGNTSFVDSLINGNTNVDTIAVANLFSSTQHGGQGNDVLTAGLVSRSIVNGNKNNDQITVTDTLGSSIYGGQGIDNISLNSGNYQNTLVSGDNNNDVIRIGANAIGSTYNNVSILGGQGDDNIAFNNAVTSFASSSILGGDGSDNLSGAAAGVGVALYGEAGSDILTGSAVNDTLVGGEAQDFITTTGGNDTITAGVGADVITLSGATTSRINQNEGDSVAATAGASAAVLADAVTFVFGNGVDYVDATAGGVGSYTGNVSFGGTATLLNNGANLAALAAGNYIIRGTWTAGTNTFSTLAAGNDSLLIKSSGTNLQVAGNLGTSSVVFDQTQLTAAQVVA